jgi:hypothetical protein
MRRSRRAGLCFGAVVVLLAIGCLSVGLATGEQTGNPEVVVSFDGKIIPRALPRHRPGPVFLQLSGGVRGTEGNPPPRLQRIELAFGAHGGLDTAGLPVCPRGRLRNATQRQALARCGGAVVGHGEITAEVPLNPTNPLSARAGALAFNGRSHGRPAVWVHAYSSSPPVSFVLPFYLRRLPRGAYGLLMRSPVRQALGRWPRLSAFSVTLGRRYGAGDALHSYLSGSCPLPARLSALSVPIARASFYFAPRPTLTQSIHRFCRVSE